jgi:ATP-binding cassette, subfamily F, member 3
MALRFQARERGGDRVVSAEQVTIAVENRVLVENFTGVVMRGDVLGFVGPNGAGKSTFVRAMFGEHPLSAGRLAVGGSVTAAHYRQDLSQLDQDSSIYDSIADLRPGWGRGAVQGHLGRFGFSGDEAQRRIGSLSGGEQARVALAMLMLSGANLLVLDEPTNHLDVESIEALEDALERYDGTVILVSHDRELLRSLTTRVWVLHDRRITQFAGGFAEWEEVSAERAHAAAVQAAEQQALRKVQERQRVGGADRRGSTDPRTRLRSARKTLERAEARVEALEARIASITQALEDPALYTRTGGVAEATRLGGELDSVRRELDVAMEQWTAAETEVEALTVDG